MWGKVSCLKKQHDGRDQATTNLTSAHEVQCAQHHTTVHPQEFLQLYSHISRLRWLNWISKWGYLQSRFAQQLHLR